MTYNPAGGQTYNLGSSIGSTDTTILLSSFTEPVSGTPYTMVLLNTDIAYGTIAPKTSSAEFISFTGITQNADGSATLTGVTRGLAKKYPFTEDVAFKLPHAGQSVFILSDAPQVFVKYVTLENTETITGLKTFTEATRPKLTADIDTSVNENLVTFGQLSRTAFAGVNNATLTVKGIVEIATTAEINAGTSLGGTGASVVVRPDQLQASIYFTQLPNANQAAALVSTQAPSAANKYITQKDLQKGLELYGTSATGNDSYAVTLSPAVTAYSDAEVFHVEVDTANTGPCSLNVNGLGAIPIKKYIASGISDPETGDILANQTITVLYLGGNFILLSRLASDNPRMGAAVSKSTGVTYTADTDGFAYGYTRDTGGGGGQLDGLINGSVVEQAYSQGTGIFAVGSICFPVARGETYRFNSSGGSVTVFFRPLGN